MWIIKKLGGREEDTFSLGGCAISSDVYFKSKAGEVTMHKGKSFDQCVASREGEGTIINIEELVDLICGKLAGSIHSRCVAAYTAGVEFIIR